MATAQATKAPPQITLSNVKGLYEASNTRGTVSHKDLHQEFDRHRHIPPIWIPISHTVFGFAYWYPNRPMPKVIEYDHFRLIVPELAQGRKNILLGYKTMETTENSAICIAVGVSILSYSFPAQSNEWRRMDGDGLPIGEVSSKTDAGAYLLSRADMAISTIVRGDVVVNREGGKAVHMEYAPTSTFPMAIFASQAKTFYPSGPFKYQNKRLLRSALMT